MFTSQNIQRQYEKKDRAALYDMRQVDNAVDVALNFGGIALEITPPVKIVPKPAPQHEYDQTRFGAVIGLAIEP